MGNFISNLVARHTTAGNYVQPRLRGRFEPQAGPVKGIRSPYFPDDSPYAEDALPAALAPSRIPQRQPSPAPPEGADHNISTPPAAHAPTSTNTISTAQPVSTPPSREGDPPVNSEGPSPIRVQARSGRQTAFTPRNSPAGDRPGPIQGTVNNALFPSLPAEKPEGARTAASGSDQRAPAGSIYFSADDPANEGAAGAPAALHAPALVPTGVRRSFSSEHSLQRPASADNTPKAETPPVIKVTIGRIDVRAAPQPASAKNTGAAPKGVMSLDDYLKKRSGGTS